MNKLSVIIPVFNEKKTILEILNRIKLADISLEKEIVIVDDCSTDGTKGILRKIEANHKNNYKFVFMSKNRGKGEALKRGFVSATGDIVLIQDADLEYNPKDYKKLITPIIEGNADVVYGSRFVGSEPHRVLYFWHYLGNRFLTILSNIFTNLNLTDMETCYKVFSREVVDSFKYDLKSKRFGIEPELTARVAKGKNRIFEVGISYNGRTYKEGKKINWKDGVAAVWHIVRFALFR